MEKAVWTACVGWAVLGVVCASRSLPAWGDAAEISTSQNGASSDTALQEIIVTAEKRSVSIQETPISMRAIDGETAIKEGISDVTGLARIAPDLQISSTDVSLKLTIRGVSALSVAETADPALTINIDGEYINRPTVINASLYDLERVEILRGPQGTLYGRNATAGALNIIDAKPKLEEFGGYATAEYGNYDAKMIQGAINLPLTPTAAIRLAGFHSDHEGYRDNAPAGRGDSGDVSSGRIGYYVEPNAAIKFYLAGEYVNVDQSGAAQLGIPFNASTPGFIDPSLEGGIPANVRYNIDPNRYPLADLGFFDSRQYAVRGRADFDLGFGLLSYIGGYRGVRGSNRQDLNGYIPTTTTQRYARNNPDTQSHELRISGDKGGVLWQAGIFYFQEDLRTAEGIFLDPFQAYAFYRYVDIKSKSTAGYTQFTVPLIADTLSFTGGVRYTADSKKGSYRDFDASFGPTGPTFPGVAAPNPPPPDTIDPIITNGDARSDRVTYSADVDWHPAPRSLVYGKISTGYKAGGFDPSGSYAPEKLTSYEVGNKNTFLNGSLIYNVSAFYYDYKNQQIDVYVNQQIGLRTESVGALYMWGVENDLSFRPSSNDTIHGLANYLFAKYTDFEAPLPGLLGRVTEIDGQSPNLRGNTPPQSPRVTLGLGLDHVWRFDEGSLTFSAWTRYTSNYFLSQYNYAEDKQVGFTQSDLSVQFAPPKDRYEIMAYVRNAEDHIPRVYSFFLVPPDSVYITAFGTPRTFGIQGTLKF